MDRSLNENIRALRMQGKYSQVELARLLNVSKQCVSNWENDNIQPSIEMLVKLADLFHVSTDYLLGRSPEHTLDVSGLTDGQITHIGWLVHDLCETNLDGKQEE